MIATLNKSKTVLTINRQEFKLALGKIGEGIDKQIASLKKAKQSYDAAEIAREVISEANIFEAIIEGFNEEEETNLKLADITNLEVAQGWIDEFLEKYGDLVPTPVLEMIKRRNQPALTWETHYHYNYS